MSDGPARRRPGVTTAQVRSVDWITRHMVRFVLAGPELAGINAGRFTDHYIKVLFPVAGVTYPEPFDLGRIREVLPREQWPRTRTYTVRSWDAERAELTVDVFYHGDVGLAGPWAASLRPGDVVRFAGPGGDVVLPATPPGYLDVLFESA